MTSRIHLDNQLHSLKKKMKIHAQNLIVILMTCTESDSDSDDEEKLEEQLIFMDLVSMNIVDLC